MSGNRSTTIKVWWLSLCVLCTWNLVVSSSPNYDPKFSLYQELSLSEPITGSDDSSRSSSIVETSAIVNSGKVLPLATATLLSLQGGGGNGNEPFVAMTQCSLMNPCHQNEMFHNEEDEDEDDDDDEDEDDDDGHSSMLSNASLQRRRSMEKRVLVSANGSEDDQRSKSSSTSSSSFVSTSTTFVPSASKSVLLKLRGGASSSVGTNEFARKLIVSALVTLLYEGALGHLLEFVKIVMQTAPVGTTYGEVLSRITSEKGIAGIWDGFIPWGVIQAIGKGGVFGLAHAVASSYLLPFTSGDTPTLNKQLALTLAGGIAGGFQGYVLSPLLLLKTRVMTNPVFREQMTLLKTTLLSLSIGFDVVANEGIGALMKGSNVFALKRLLDWSTRFYFADVFTRLLLNLNNNVPLSPLKKIAADLLGGTASTIVTLPLDVLVAKSQDAKKAGVKVSAWEMLTKDYKEGGWKGLYNANMMGFEARLLHVCFTTVAMKTGTGVMYEFLYGKN